MSRRTASPASLPQPSAQQSLRTEVLAGVTAEVSAANAEPAGGAAGQTSGHRAGTRRPPAGLRRPALYLAAAVAGGIVVSVLGVGQPDAQADAAADQPVSIAAQLGLSAQQSDTSVSAGEVGERLGELVADRSQREADEAAAAQAQAAADQAVLDARAAAQAQAAAEAKALADAQAAADAKAAADEQAAADAQAAADERAATEAAAATRSTSSRPTATATASSGSASSGSYQDYALAQLGGDSSEMSCLESLWGKESSWNPDAQNPSSSAYGIPQFLDSTWKGTGIAKTSDGYRQIDAGLIYIDSRYGSPCGAWSHSKSTGWY